MKLNSVYIMSFVLSLPLTLDSDYLTIRTYIYMYLISTDDADDTSNVYCLT